ncbi:hypothetical protein [Streptomyces sp. cg36]|uniref:hypothetical protein n=1 Tax=Streptomyces sp. cg36 TaxID=3238798 RepID=UPI0034E3005D
MSVAVVNGDFTQPAFTGDYTDNVVYGWSVGSTADNDGNGIVGGVGRFSSTASGHPGGKPAVTLRKSGDTSGFKQRLRGVRPGAKVTVTFDDSPTVRLDCGPRSTEQGQSYTLQAPGGAVSSYRTEPDPDKQFLKLGSGVWRTGLTYSFTSTEYEPLLTFTSTLPDNVIPAADADPGTYDVVCGPMIANVTAVQVQPPLDKTIPANKLPSSLAFRGNDKRTVIDGVNACNADATPCKFTPLDDYSFASYAPARVADEGYINCTRETQTRERPLQFSSRTVSDLPPEAGLPPVPASKNMTKQFTTGTGTSPSWNPTTGRMIKEIVQPNEVAWIETQAARQRTEGWFTSSPTPVNANQDWRVYTVLDYPSPHLSDRVYQRTGPLAPAELQRCRSHRPNAVTPNGADAPATGADRESNPVGPPGTLHIYNKP